MASPETCLSALSCLTLLPTPVVMSARNSSASSAWVLCWMWLDIRGHPGFDFGSLQLEEEFTQQILCSEQAVFLAGAEVTERSEILGQCSAGAFDHARIPGRALQSSFTGSGAFRDSGHATEGDACALHHAIFDHQVKGGADGGDVVVQTFGHLVGAERLIGLMARHDDLLDKFGFLAGSHLVIEEVIFKGGGAAAVALAQDDLRAEGDQQRRGVANRRGVADIAAQGGRKSGVEGERGDLGGWR